MIKLRPSQYPTFSDDLVYDGLVQAIERSLFYLNTRPKKTVYYFGLDPYPVDHVIKSLRFFLDFIQQHPSSHDLNRFVSLNYWVYRSVGSDGKGRVLFTGYYEPFLRGRLNKDDTYRYPVYATPEDLISIDLSAFSEALRGKHIVGRIDGHRFVPYFDRAEIDFQGALVDKSPVLVWLKDPVELFFLHIQGSGKIFTGKTAPLNVHYASSNGRPYRSIGKLLLDEGKISKAQMSMQSIRDYLKQYPEEIPRVFQYNPSYVFFKIEEEGPLGYIDVKLTPCRSLALDKTIFPPAALSYIETQTPLVDGGGNIQKWTGFNCFVLNQDTGGAIKGPGRGDLFWGNGEYAEIAAGHMQQPGNLYFIVLKP